MADDINSCWFPNPDILRLAYQRNRSHFHGIDHILRVWTYAMHIAYTHHPTRVDMDVLSVAALFHDIGRKNDLKDPKHGIRSATWVNEILPALAPELQDSQIEMIKVLCRLHNQPDGELSTIELKILKDADALDRSRLPRGRIKKEFLRLPETTSLIPDSQKFYSDWKEIAREEKDPFNIMIIAIRNSEQFSELLPSEVKSRTEVQVTKRSLLRYLDIVEDTLQIIDQESSMLTTRLNNGTLRFRDLRKLRSKLSELDKAKESSPSPILHDVFVQGARASISQHMRLGLADHTIHTALRSKYRKLYEQVSKDPRCELDIPNGDLYQLISIEDTNEHPHVMRAVVEHLAFCRQFQELIMILAFTDINGKRLFLESFGRRYRLYQRLRFSFPEDQVRWQRWLWVVAIGRWVKSATKLLDDGDEDRARHMLEYIHKFIEQMLEKIEFTVPQLTELLSYLNDIVEISDRFKLDDLAHSRCLRFWQEDYDTLGGMNEFPGGFVRQNLDIFYLYDGNQLNSSRHLYELERYLINTAKSGENIDMAIRNYLLPAHLNKPFKYSISIDLIQQIRSDEIRILVKRYTDKKHAQLDIHDVSLEIVKEDSQKNLRSLMEPSKFRSLVNAKKNYKILTNISNISILEDIVDNHSALLSIWNIFSQRHRPFVVRKGYEMGYFRRTKYRGVLQRHMLIRRPNILKDHTFYGTLQNLDEVLADPGILGRIPSPTDIFTSKRYGSVVVVFKDEVVERTLFLLLDSFWEHRGYPVAFEEAKYIYEKIKDDPIGTSLETNPMSIVTSYVEANILKGLDLNDVEMVLIPLKVLKKKRKTIEKVKSAYPHIEFKGV